MIAHPQHGPGRCRSCGHWLSPLDIRDGAGKFMGLSAERGNCINRSCLWVWSEQSLTRTYPGPDRDAEVRALAVENGLATA